MFLIAYGIPPLRPRLTPKPALNLKLLELPAVSFEEKKEFEYVAPALAEIVGKTSAQIFFSE